LELSRKMDTGDSQDRPILIDKDTKVIMAYGDDGEDNLDTYHTPRRRKASAISFSGKPFVNKLKELIDDPNILSFEFLNNWTISADANVITAQGKKLEKDGKGRINHVDDVTVYVDLEMGLREDILKDDDIYILGVEHIISKHSDEYVHHFGLSGRHYDYEDETFVNSLGIYGWAPGVPAQITAPDCVFLASVNDTKGINFLLLGTHYDNPLKKEEGYIDTSGVKIYYKKKSSYQQVPVLCGFHNVGQVTSNPNPFFPKGLSMYEYDCPPNETMNWRHPNITVLHSFLHMHTLGRQIWIEIYRDGKFLKEASRNDFWDFNFQAGVDFEPGEMIIKRGDGIKLTCIYDTSNNSSKFGLASQDEMCTHGFLYYPRLTPEDEFECVWDFRGYTNVKGQVQRTMKYPLRKFTYNFGLKSTNEICPNSSPTTTTPHSSPTTPLSSPTTTLSSPITHSSPTTPHSAAINLNENILYLIILILVQLM